ncbi:phosphatidylcholine transfer protein isoform X4 [Melanerpes formicivorus]|uniref:phosphatidylcholine transfer protein isoform X4 n=1 Tax=Melanerpes formicivorus TaxID=211600 RepID=UPI00358F9FE5
MELPGTMEPLPPRGFSEQQFQAACRELDQPAPAAGGPWQLLVETMGVRIYRLYDEQSGLYEYKIFGGLADCPPELCVDVYMDLDFRKQWDQYVKELYEETYNGEKVIYWEVKFPFPLSNRDPGIIRVSSYKQSLVIESDGKAGSKVYMYYFDNPGGMIPSWLVNWAAKSGVPAFLKDIQKACHSYPKST